MCSARDVDTLICSEGMRTQTALLLLALTWPRNGADRAESIKLLLAAAHRKSFSSSIPSNRCQKSNQSGGRQLDLARDANPQTSIFVWLGLEKAQPGKNVCVCAADICESGARMSRPVLASQSANKASPRVN